MISAKGNETADYFNSEKDSGEYATVTAGDYTFYVKAEENGWQVDYVLMAEIDKLRYSFLVNYSPTDDSDENIAALVEDAAMKQKAADLIKDLIGSAEIDQSNYTVEIK